MEKSQLLALLRHTAEIYEDLKGPRLEVAICGGTALNLLGLVERPTRDVDVVSPEVWPENFKRAVSLTAQRYGLPKDWINQGPVDLLRMGLPEGYFSRCERLNYVSNLIFLITSRFDQIHFKLYASLDRGGYHVVDLKSLNPTTEELLIAATWCMTHDVSEPFRKQMVSFLNMQGWSDVARQLEK